MSERPTPETDCESGFFDMETAVSAAFARRLERERDEAREALENHTASTIHSCHDQCQRPMCVLRRERDKAIKLFESGKRACASLNEALDKTLHELREVREQNAKLTDIAERAIIAVALWAGSRTNSASELRAELEHLKETK